MAHWAPALPGDLGYPSFTPNQAMRPRAVGAAWPAALQASLLLHHGHDFLQKPPKFTVLLISFLHRSSCQSHQKLNQPTRRFF